MNKEDYKMVIPGRRKSLNRGVSSLHGCAIVERRERIRA
jgi:hypothetical protein